MNILSAKVCHEKYGIGTVIAQVHTIITVSFSDDCGTKKFLYPSVFEGFLKLCGDELQAKQMEEIAHLRAEADAVLAQKAA